MGYPLMKSTSLKGINSYTGIVFVIADDFSGDDNGGRGQGGGGKGVKSEKQIFHQS